MRSYKIMFPGIFRFDLYELLVTIPKTIIIYTKPSLIFKFDPLHMQFTELQY